MATVRQSGGDYADIEAAIVANETVIAIDETWTIDDGWTTTLTIDAGNATTITCSGGAETIGRPHASAETTYRGRRTGTGHAFQVADSLTIIGMDLQSAATDSSAEIIRHTPDNDLTVTFTDCVVGFSSRVSEQDVIYSDESTSMDITFIATNTVFYNAYRAVCDFQDITIGVVDLNCCDCFDVGFSTAEGNRSGVVGVNLATTSITVRVFNGKFDINTGVAFTAHSTNTNGDSLTIDRSITSMATWELNWADTITDSLVSRTWTDDIDPGAGSFVIVEDTTTSPFDMRLQDNATDNDAQDLHADGSGAGLTMPADDIIGTTRPQNTNHDAGMFEVAVAGGNLAGSATITLTGSSTLLGTGELSGTATVTLSASGTLSAAGLIDGTATLSLAGSSTLKGTGDLAGSTSITLSAAGTASGKGTLSGTATITLAGSSTLLGQGKLDGSAAVVLSGSSTLVGTGKLDGSTSVLLSASGTLVGLSAGSISGTATIAITGSSTLKGKGSLDGIGSITVTGTATLSATVKIDGIGSITLSASGTLTTLEGNLQGTAEISFFTRGIAMDEDGIHVKNNPKVRLVNIITQFSLNGHQEWTNSKAEKDSLSDFESQVGQRYYLWTNPDDLNADGHEGVPLYRLFSKPGHGLAYTTRPRRGQRHHLDRLLGYMSPVQKFGMVEVAVPRGTLNLSEDSRYQSDFRDFEKFRFYAYPKSGSWDGDTATAFASIHEPRTFKYSGGNFDHTIEFNELAPHIWRWRVEDTAAGLDLQFVSNGGTGRGMQGSMHFIDDREFDLIDNYPCMTNKNPQQAGHSSGPPISEGDSLPGSVLVSYEQGASFIEFTCIPMNNQNDDAGPVSPVDSEQRPDCFTFYGGQDDTSPIDVTGIWPTLKYRMRIDFDYLGRVGVHRLTFDFTTPAAIVALPQQSGFKSAILHDMPIFVLVNFADEAYVYDPDNHTAPFLCSGYTVPTLSTVGRLEPGGAPCVPAEPGENPLAWDEWWSFLVTDAVIVGERRGRETECDSCFSDVSHAFASPGDPPNEPRFKSSKASVFLHSRFPAAAASGDKFGLGIAAPISPRGPASGLVYMNIQGPCHPDYNSTNENVDTLQGIASRVLLVSAAGDQHIAWPAGTTSVVQYVITDKFDDYQGHVDFLNAQGLL